MTVVRMIENYTLIKWVTNGWVVTNFTEDVHLSILDRLKKGVRFKLLSCLSSVSMSSSDELFLRGELDTEPNELDADFLHELADTLGIERGSKHTKKRLKIGLVDADDFFD